MPIYHIKGPNGTERIIEAATKRGALSKVVDIDYAIEPVSAVRLAELVRGGAYNRAPAGTEG